MAYEIAPGALEREALEADRRGVWRDAYQIAASRLDSPLMQDPVDAANDALKAFDANFKPE